jgi:hypothetical protein
MMLLLMIRRDDDRSEDVESRDWSIKEVHSQTVDQDAATGMTW